MEDRDLLLAETQALLSELARAKPGMATGPDVASFHEVEAEPERQFGPLQFERLTPLTTVNEREEIANRLAAFRATQARFQREREAFSMAMLSKARAGKIR
jgi:hypothetical protein